MRDQIGWSNEIKLLNQISKKLDRLTEVFGNLLPPPITSSTTTSTSTTVEPQALILGFDNISSANTLVGDASDVADWNTFFDLPTFGTPFTSVEIDGNNVRLFGGENIEIKQELFISNNSIIQVIDESFSVVEIGVVAFDSCSYLTNVNFPAVITIGDYCFYFCDLLSSVNLPTLINSGEGCFQSCQSLISADFPNLITAGDLYFDDCQSLTTANLPNLTSAGLAFFQLCISLNSVNLQSLENTGDYCFFGCNLLTSIDLPQITTIGDYCFNLCESLESLEIPSCTNLGTTVGDNSVFLDISSQTISLTIPSALMTVNGGNPDGDIQYLQANNTVTITTV